jgi:hypothetical protein
MKSLEYQAMRVEWRRDIGRKPGHVLPGLMFAMFIVAVAVFGPPLTGQSIVPMIELRHHVLMIDREFEQEALLLDGSSGPTGAVITDERSPPRSSKNGSKLRARGGIA